MNKYNNFLCYVKNVKLERLFRYVCIYIYIYIYLYIDIYRYTYI